MDDAAEYCREIERYLCRKNEGHLIRVVGPVFEQVSGWAAQGVPLAIAFRGIDRFCERYYAKGPRRRPVRVEFCEADILELFDDWRRAVGVAAPESSDEGDRAPRNDSLPAHLDRAINRLTAMRAGRHVAVVDARVDATVRELDAMRARARNARGEARAVLLERLASLDRELLEAAREEIPADRREALRTEAEAEILPFAARMDPEGRRQAIHAAFNRLLRESIGLPGLCLE
ncbi:MAG TPA: hypothetical protein VGL62_07410 [Vicinamibacterales bacterium]|jgi:hypothetical protein